jgi:CRISPR-associated endonuclease/helicase Cas3
MRGGLTIDTDWVLDPTRPSIIVSTVDQVGSRLLFRGYGVSNRTASIQAGLLGNDALWILDEVHLAQPLLQTLGAVSRMRGDAIDLPLRVLPMSATWSGANTHGLMAADDAHPVLGKRLNRPKPARLLKLKAGEDVSQALVDEALEHRRRGSDVVAVVCNRVATARAALELLRRQGDAVLLTGRIRPADKEALLAEYLPRLATGTRGQRGPLFVVATQTIEVGADLDFDAMVSEHAPISALRQRAGRLNRLGELPSAPMTIVYRPDKNDRVYGKRVLDDAWKWLNRVATGRGKAKAVDFGVNTLADTLAAEPAPTEPAPMAPLLLASHVDSLAQTSPAPDVDVAPWLHGWGIGAPEVYLAWRADCNAESVTAAPPRQHELLPVPVWSVRNWSAAIADIQDAGEEEAHDTRRTALRYDGESAVEVRLVQVRPGDTLVLPCTAGGSDAFGWAPESKALVTDVGDDTRRIRLHPSVHPELAEAIAALDQAQAPVSAWRRLAKHAGLPNPGGVLAIPDGRVVLSRMQWTSEKAYTAVLLRDHSGAVADAVRRLAQSLGLPHPLVAILQRAAKGHDAGKADLRWQAGVGGDGTELLAKGPRGDDPWLPLPKGWRHELASVARLPKDAPPLVRWLVGTHHGHGRPEFPAAPDFDLWRQAGDWAGMQARLQAEWGVWGLAYLEALLRLADWQVSDAEQADDEGREAA